MKAFLTALLLFLNTVVGIHFYIQDRVAVDNPEFSTWSDEEKAVSLAGLTENMNAGSIPVFGSSEFQHGRDTAYHPANLFAGNRFNPMLIGAGYYQSLSHAVTLSAIEEAMENRKAVLILSPQWFRKTGVVDQAYTSRFSEVLYAQMLKNEKLSDETKAYIADRTQLLLQVDPKTQVHAKNHEEVLWKKKAGYVQTLQEHIWDAFLKEKDKFSIVSLQQVKGIQRGVGLPETDVVPDWNALMAQAEAEGKLQNTNELYIDDTSYARLEPVLESKKGMNADAKKGYQNSPEYDDLRCFLRVCRELNIEPMLVIVPVNGYYYDYTEFPQSARQAYYGLVKGVAEEFGVQVADFSNQEYTKYFFEDRVHLGKKGWVMVCESIYNFYREM